MKQKRQRAWRAGYRAELIAAIYLSAMGYRVLARRYKTPVGEIDLIVASKKRLAFVEVKGRAGADQVLHAVTAKQQQRIRRAAEYWLARQNTAPTGEIGFDVVGVMPWKFPRHYKDAFSHKFI